MKPIAMIIGAVVLVLAYNSVFTVNMTQTALVLQLQEYQKTIHEPGLYFKIPIYQEVRYFTKQLLVNDEEPTEVITKDKKNLLIDSYSMWRITDPLLFFQTVHSERGGQARLDDIIKSELRVELGTHDLIDVVTITREAIMTKVATEVNVQSIKYGIHVLDVRIKRADLPAEIANSIFSRMRTERERIAKEYRSEGKEEATKIRAETDKERVILIAEAYKQEQIIRGDGDGKSTKIYANAFNKDRKFYSFMRSMQAYKQSFQSGTTILLSENSDFLEFLNKSR